MTRFDPVPETLSAAQADGLACVVCNADYLTVRTVHRPVGRSRSGSQVFACTTCVPAEAEDAKGVHTVDTLGGEKGTQIVSTPGGRRLAPLSVRMDADLAADLAVMARAGLNASDAVRVALGIVAGTYANAWAAGVVPEGVRPDIAECVLRPHGGPPAV